MAEKLDTNFYSGVQITSDQGKTTVITENDGHKCTHAHDITAGSSGEDVRGTHRDLTQEEKDIYEEVKKLAYTDD